MTELKHNVLHLLEEAANRHPKRTALIFSDGEISFESLLSRVKKFASMMKANGLKPGDRAIIMIPMSPDLYVSMLGVIYCGGVAVFVDPWIPMRQIAAFSAFAAPSALIGVPKSHLLRLMNRKLAALKISVSTGPVMFGFPARLSLSAAESHAEMQAPEAVNNDSSALITFTSGSSGIPKGANRTHGFLRAQYEALCSTLDYRSDDVDMPMFPVFALRNLAAGITSVIPQIDFRDVGNIDTAVVVRQIHEAGVSLLTASPPFIDQLAAVSPLPGLRCIFTGGAPVRDEQLQCWQQAFPNVAIEIIYGSTEAEPVAHLSCAERLAISGHEGFCCGRPTELLRTRIIKIRKGRVDAGELEALTLPQGDTGELLVAGKHVCRDYFHNSDAVKDNKITEPDGTCWHRMGDTGYFDKEGRFFLTGRVHSTIIRNGEMLHAQMVEQRVLEQVPSAVRVAALEMDGKLLVVIEGHKNEGMISKIDADQVIFTSRLLPLDPRHKSKIDYDALRKLIRRGKMI